uniref:SET domain-containing protein n=1 Tax=Leptocylindrus danicus TaxID=163516 RepID=A0A7S2JZ65_9STRA|mmetsp:Transcript_14105/g.20857  ORF Transcript_14105/g.20857 Transcript_14105/m.20857 type:complete len:591 (+) Transcript_14105:122-1894(+)
MVSASISPKAVALLCAISYVSGFTCPNTVNKNNCMTAFRNAPRTQTFMAGGEGGESEWAKALQDARGEEPGSFEKEMKMRGLMGKKGVVDPKLSQNANLIKWLEEKGEVYLSDSSTWGTAPHPMAISVETVDETTNETTGRGLLARRNINDGDELLQIPMRLCLTLESARTALGKDVITNGMNEYLAIATQLIHETYVLGEKSFWKPYIDVLPTVEEVNPTFTWPDEDLDFLKGSPVVPATKSLQIKLRKEYDALLGGEGGLCERFPDRFPREAFSYENWVWAFTMLFSRAIRLRNLEDGEALALVPYADLINHSPFSGAYVDAREVGDWLFKDGTEEVILYADRSYRKMEQIYISYGPKSNADLLLLYGFALERNPFNSVDVTVSIAPRTKDMVDSIDNPDVEIDPLAEEKIEFLDRVGRENTVDFPCYADRYPIEMLEYLRLMQMTPEDTRGRPLRDFDFSRTISAANEAAVLSSIIDAITRQLGKYPNSEDDDAMIIQDKGLFRLLNINQRNAVRHRRNEKRLLKRTVAALQKQMRTRGLMEDDLQRAGGSTLGQALPGDDRMYGEGKPRTALEDRLAKMGLPVDIR